MANQLKIKGELNFLRSDARRNGRYGKVFRAGRFKDLVDVAIARVDKMDFTVDTDLLLKVDLMQCHPNIVRFYTAEDTIEYQYIATERSAGSLKDLVRSKYDGPTIGSNSQILQQITSGVEYLHSIGVTHRNLKPSNILISDPFSIKTVRPCMKLCNFGFTRISPEGAPYPLWKRNGSDQSWMAPEIYTEEEFTTAMDIFSLGLIYAYVLSGGVHPFGVRKEFRIIKLAAKAQVVNKLQDVIGVGGIILKLIYRMLSYDPKERPPALVILDDPFFNPPQNVIVIREGQVNDSCGSSCSTIADNQTVNSQFPGGMPALVDVDDLSSLDQVNPLAPPPTADSVEPIASTSSAASNSSPSANQLATEPASTLNDYSRQRIIDESEEIGESRSLVLRLRKHRILPNQQRNYNSGKQKRLANKKRSASVTDDQPDAAVSKFSKSDATAEGAEALQQSSSSTTASVKAHLRNEIVLELSDDDDTTVEYLSAFSQSESMSDLFCRSDSDQQSNSGANRSSFDAVTGGNGITGDELASSDDVEATQRELFELCSQNNLDCQQFVQFRELAQVKEININAVYKNVTPLLQLCLSHKSNKLYDCISILLERDDVDINANGSLEAAGGSNCLLALASKQHGHCDFIPIVELLVKNGVDVNYRNNQGMNLVHLLCKLCKINKLMGVLQCLFSTSKTRIEFNVRDHLSGRTPLEYLQSRRVENKNKIIQFLQSKLKL